MSRHHTDAIEASILEFIGQDLLGGDDAGLDAQTPLLACGILDSLNLLVLVDFVEEEFGVEFAAENLRPERVENVAVVADYVRQHTRRAA